MPIPDREVPEILDLIAKLVASVSTRLDTHGEALAHVAKAQAEAKEGGDPDYVARATAEAVRRVLVPEVNKIVEALNELNGTKAVLRARWRIVDQEEARLGRWLFQPLAVSLGIPLALGLLLAAFMPSAVAQTPLTCRGAGGLWLVATERYPAACRFEAHGRLHQATGEDGQADAESS
jgi:hypothetical protein